MQRRATVLLASSMLLLAMLACGGFQLRGTPTPRPSPALIIRATQRAPSQAATVVAPTPSPTAAEIPNPTPTQVPGLGPGKMARVTATGGLNVRDAPAASGNRIGKLDPGAIVKVIGGPAQADSYTWWQIDDGAGLMGWVAAGPADEPWLVEDVGTPAAGGGRLVSRPVRLGDRVQVTTEQGKVLTIREAAGLDAAPLARVLPGTQFIVRGGPVRQDGYLWWQVEGEQVKGWAAEGTEQDRWLTPVEP
jgi:hypothetical protein